MSNEDVDWSVTEDLDVIWAVESAAREIARDFESVCEQDDCVQEGLIYAASHAEEIRGYLERRERGFMRNRIRDRLFDIYKRAGRKASQVITIDRVDRNVA